MMIYRELSDKVKNNRGILSLLRTRADNLSDKRRAQFLEQNPAIAAIYNFQQELHQILMNKTCAKERCRKLIPDFLNMIQLLKQSAFNALASLGKTLHKWREEIVRMWRFSKSIGSTEGFHRKMKLIQRGAYGFRNIENYRTRVRVLCR